MRSFLIGALAAVTVLAAGSALWAAKRPVHRGPEPAVVVDAVREAVKLEVLEVKMHRVVRFEPDPPPADTMGQAFKGWVKDLLAHEEGSAVVFATARYRIDFRRIDAGNVYVRDRTAWVTLPPTDVVIELDPAETLVIRSTLSAGGETALLAGAKTAFTSTALADQGMRRRAHQAAENAVRAVLARLGIGDVRFGEAAPFPAS